jgi:hypothetical protein
MLVYTYELLRITGTGTKHGKDMDMDIDLDRDIGHGHGHGHRQNYVSKITFSRGHSKQYSISSSMPKKRLFTDSIIIFSSISIAKIIYLPAISTVLKY